MNEEYSIIVEQIKKKFRVYHDKGSSLKEKVLFKKRNSYEERWVIKDISFKIKKGEAIGLIGHNGCGKSTTLKLLTRIMYPDAGKITMNGRVSSLLELGAGFHPDMSGRENIYTNASIFGLTKKEIDARIKDIIDFSEMEEFLDNPVRTYSSGMYMRLAFSVAINVNADILLIDEILAVGDVNFQAKCFNKLRELKAEGTTIVIVSHSLGQIEQICDRSIWIQDGVVRLEGTPRSVHPEFLDFMGQKRQEVIDKQNKEEAKEEKETADITESETKEEILEQTPNDKRWGNGKAKIVEVNLMNINGKEQEVFKTNDSIIVKVSYDVISPFKNAVFGIGIFRSDGIQCYGTNTVLDQLDNFDLNHSGDFKVHLKEVKLLPGSYTIDIAIQCDVGTAIDYYREAQKFEVYSDISDVGVMRIDHEWLIK